MSFIVHRVAGDGNQIGPKLRSFGSYPAAKRYARQKAQDWFYGTAIVDSIRGITDWGNEFTDQSGRAVDTPFYARREIQ